MKQSKRYSAYGRQIPDHRGFLHIGGNIGGFASAALQRAINDDSSRRLRRSCRKFFGDIKPDGGRTSGYIQQCGNIRQLFEPDL